jgi:hypothetical protein
MGVVWDIQKEKGDIGEILVIKHFCNYFGGELLETNDTEVWDFLMRFGGVNKTFEVKTEFRIQLPRKLKNGGYTKGSDTGNLFIEFKTSTGKLSGISVTEADIWVSYIPALNEIWYIEVETLRGMIKSNNFQIGSFLGENGTITYGHLIPRHCFREFFSVRKI